MSSLYPIQSLDLDEFRGFHDGPRIEFGELTALVGPNGSGKTTVLRALQLMFALHFEPLSRLIQTVLSERDRRIRLSMDHLLFIQLGFQFRWQAESASLDYELRLSTPTSPANLRGPGQLDRTHEWLRRHAELDRDEQPPMLLRLDPAAIAAPSYSEEVVPSIGEDGSGVASVLADLAVSSPERFAAVQERARRIVPGLERIRLVRAPVERTETEIVRIDEQAIERKRTRTFWGHRMVLDMRGCADLPATSASEGTLVAIALVTLLEQPRAPRLLLIDDVERGLHPLAQGRLVEVLRELVAERPAEQSLQIVMTSHSPYLVDHLRPDEVWLTDLDPQTGHALCARLTDHPEFPKWKDALGTGEFWSTFGEGWIHERSRPQGPQEAPVSDG